MESFRPLCVESISRTLRLDGLDIVNHLMKLRYVEVLSNALPYENLLIVMEHLQCILQRVQGFRGMYLQASVVDKIDNCPCCSQNLWLDLSHKKTYKHMLHLFMLSACPLRHTLERCRVTRTHIDTERGCGKD